MQKLDKASAIRTLKYSFAARHLVCLLSIALM
jgi:hypothetical protein